MIYIFLGLLALLTFGATVSDNIQIGAPLKCPLKCNVITVYTTIMTIFGLLMAAAFYNNAALRDFNNEFNEILFSTPLKKSGYFFGKFCGALLLSTIPLIGVFLGTIIGTITAPLFGWIDADRFVFLSEPLQITIFITNIIVDQSYCTHLCSAQLFLCWCFGHCQAYIFR